jgi:cytochrome P450
MEFATPDYTRHPDNKQLDHIPGTYGTPLIGNTFRFVVAPFETLDREYRRWGPVFKTSLTFQKMVVALGPEFIQQLMLDSQQSFSARMGYETPLGDFFAGGLLMRDFAEHKFHRRIMQTAFKIDAMRTYVSLMQPIIEEQIAGWGGQDDFHFYPNVKTLLLDVGAKVFLGMDMAGDETRALNQAFLDMNEGTVALIRKDWPGLKYHKAMKGRRALEDFFISLVPQRRGGSGSDMATFFANERTEDGDYFSDKVVGEHLIFLLLAAHDTTTSALSMATYYLANDQAWQSRLREELQGLGKPALEYDDLGQQVPDLDHCFKETLRLNPPVPMLMRRTVKEVELGGYLLQPHTMVQISPLYTQRMEAWWSNPHGFDPDRFAREEHKQHSFLWAPFGGGAHKCIGLHFADMLFKCTLAELLQRYRIRFARPGQYPSKIQHFPFAKPMDDLPLVLEPLNA